ncbi:MFS transporter [Lyticum sinuosum]|uniref:MFS transporter n=1 Tax=Lyticum sinuosum TaxID=1332059 RepID=A0AAE4VKR2_9RICK|nr:MFS transporter [Lyticum sinuosum]MDZ5761213.1 MFS transporter [Lyticum sinuosum]
MTKINLNNKKNPQKNHNDLSDHIIEDKILNSDIKSNSNILTINKTKQNTKTKKNIKKSNKKNILNNTNNANNTTNNSDEISDAGKRKIISTTIIGNIVEYYDFGMYAVFAAKIGNIFFPGDDENFSLLLSFIVFAIGFIMRPLGAVVFGYVGDKFGRKVALRMSISGMAISTIGMALLPSYNSIGIIAPILLVIIRLIQGLCIGGEGTGSAIYIIEHMNEKKSSLVGSLVMSSNYLGTLIAYGVGIMIEKFFGIDDITWRYGFGLGALAGLIGTYFRSKNGESPVFHKLKETKALIKKPFSEIFKKKKLVSFSIITSTGAAVSLSYLIRGYMNSFYTEILHYSPIEAMYFTCFALLLIVILLPIFGIISDIIGCKNMLMVAAFSIAMWSLQQFLLIIDDSNYNKFMGITLLSVLCAAMSAPLYPYAIMSFPPELRYSGVSLSYNLGNALFGGTTPLICAILVEKFGILGPAYYITGTSAIFIITNLSIIIFLHRIRQRKSFFLLKKSSKKNY